ncbi:MAG: carboxynorspermidine decarboxylase [Candidatus Omnitrophica bacterium]|nr:carboxynorspermidine decarboxylase [Candidatus Omnitrophota bacterium]MDD5574635.1 carboxynorspermidine decarboxylase [Candidatus Omnitrophota bacterium]
MILNTPYYLIDEKKLLKNLRVIQHIREVSGAKFVLALKCFAAWSVFGLMRRYMDGTTSSSVYEARLGHEKFGKEVHAYCVAFSDDDVKEVSGFADKVIFNSFTQLERLGRLAHPDTNTMRNGAQGCRIGVRVNPGTSFSRFDLADPARKYSRLGVTDRQALKKALPRLSGVMFHYNCENDDVEHFARHLDRIGRVYGDVLKRLEWVSIGGGFYFTKKGYPVGKFCEKLKAFGRTFGIQVYLEPGEAAITQAAQLVTRVLDVVRNKIDIAIVDASTEAHMLDLLIYRQNARLRQELPGRFPYMVAGRSCLAGDIFGTYRLDRRLKVGSEIRFLDAAGYTMVKKNWFNGLQMPSIVVKRLNGSTDVVRRFGYRDYVASLS